MFLPPCFKQFEQSVPCELEQAGHFEVVGSGEGLIRVFGSLTTHQCCLVPLAGLLTSPRVLLNTCEVFLHPEQPF